MPNQAKREGHFRSFTTLVCILVDLLIYQFQRRKDNSFFHCRIARALNVFKRKFCGNSFAKQSKRPCHFHTYELVSRLQFLPQCFVHTFLNKRHIFCMSLTIRKRQLTILRLRRHIWYGTNAWDMCNTCRVAHKSTLKMRTAHGAPQQLSMRKKSWWKFTQLFSAHTVKQCLQQILTKCACVNFIVSCKNLKDIIAVCYVPFVPFMQILCKNLEEYWLYFFFVPEQYSYFKRNFVRDQMRTSFCARADMPKLHLHVTKSHLGFRVIDSTQGRHSNNNEWVKH